MQIEVHNYAMYYEDQGSGIPLLLIHGFPLNSQLWKPQIEGLSDIARVLAPDLPGHGRTEAKEGPYWMDELAEDMDAFLDELEITVPVVVAGLSMGGYIALAYHRQHSSRMAGLILASTRAEADPPQTKQNREKVAEIARKQGVKPIVDDMLPKLLSPKTRDERPEIVQQARDIMEQTSVEGIVGASLGMKDRPDSSETLDKIMLPTLIIHGADDRVVPLSRAEEMHKRIVKSRLEVISDAGHLVNLEQPDRFNEIIRDFLSTL